MVKIGVRGIRHAFGAPGMADASYGNARAMLVVFRLAAMALASAPLARRGGGTGRCFASWPKFGMPSHLRASVRCVPKREYRAGLARPCC